jgi:hypothetical protein
VKVGPATVARDSGAEKPCLGTGKRVQPLVEEAGFLVPTISWHAERRPPVALRPFVTAAAEICRDLGEQWAASRAA